MHREQLPEDVLISVQGVTKAPPEPLPMPPKWLARLLPGVEWSVRDEQRERDLDDDDLDDDDLDDYDPEERAGIAFKEFNFDVPAGAGLGLVGPDAGATQYLLFILIGFRPPSTGRILVRGQVAPLLKGATINIGGRKGKEAVSLLARYLGWPQDMMQGGKWDEIVEFARLEEVTFPKGTVEYDKQATKRLVQSAALLLDGATVYVVGHNFARGDPSFSERCYEVLERRQQEGCAVVQNAVTVEEVSRLCQEAIYVEGGTPMLRGRLGEIASFARQREEEEKKEGARVIPLRALLLDEDLELGARGGKIEIELDVFKQDLEVDLAMLFVDEIGHEIRVERPKAFAAREPGVYRLTIDVPSGLLGYSSYKATLLATGDNGASGEHELLSFDFMSRGVGPGPAPELEPDPDLGGDPDGDFGDETGEVEWNVHRASA